MSLADFRALMIWLYGDPPKPAHDDTRINARNLRGYMEGRSSIPPALADYLVGRAALRLTLKGWQDDPPTVSPATLERIRTWSISTPSLPVSVAP